jgi:hypothetical protein
MHGIVITVAPNLVQIVCQAGLTKVEGIKGVVPGLQGFPQPVTDNLLIIATATGLPLGQNVTNDVFSCGGITFASRSLVLFHAFGVGVQAQLDAAIVAIVNGFDVVADRVNHLVRRAAAMKPCCVSSHTQTPHFAKMGSLVHPS